MKRRWIYPFLAFLLAVTFLSGIGVHIADSLVWLKIIHTLAGMLLGIFSFVHIMQMRPRMRAVKTGRHS